LWGSPPSFPWENFSNELGKTLQIPSLTIKPIETRWRSKEELTEGLGNQPILHGFHASPLEGKAYFLLPREELKTLLSLVVQSQQEFAFLDQDEYLDEFYDFLSIAAMHTFEKVKFDPSLSLQLLNETDLPDAPCLAVDIEIGSQSKTFRGRLLFT